MARQPRKSRTKAVETEKLVAAVKFVAASHKTSGAEYQDHLLIQNKCIIAFDGVLAAGALIDEDLHACPNLKQMVAAIGHCKVSSALTQINSSILRVSSSTFRANISCIDPGKMQHAWPDTPICAATQDLIDALVIAGNLVADSADRVIQCSVMLTDNLVASTDNGMAIQIWTGLPTCGYTVAIPKVFINLLAKTKKAPKYIGIGTSSLTVFYTDDSWYRTQLYDVTWPPIDRVFASSDNVKFTTIPANFHTGITDIYPFSENNVAYIADNIVATHTLAEQGAFSVISVPMGHFKTSIKHLALLKGIGVQQYGIYDVPGSETFYASGVLPSKMMIRAAISAME